MQLERQSLPFRSLTHCSPDTGEPNIYLRPVCRPREIFSRLPCAQAPEEILPEAGPLAAVVSGFFAERAGKPKIPTAPQVRVEQLRTALPWAVPALELEPHDGPAAG